jgi:mannose-6-phosphate isomerase-like protein (cupin superfamily)
MRKLKVDLGELEMALDNTFPEHRYFLDLETGKVVLVTDETGRELEEIYAELPEDVQDAQIVEAIRRRNLQDWQTEELLQADQVERGYRTRYIRIEAGDPYADYRAMEDFTPALHQTQCGASVSTVKDARLRDRLWRAISGRGAFRYFKDVLEDNPRERERWFAFKDAQVRQRVLDWLAEENIEPIE